MQLTEALGKHWKLIIAGVFLIALLVQLGLVTWVWRAGIVNSEDYAPLALRLLTIYSVPFGVISGGIFASKYNSRKAAGPQLWAALTLCVIWNGLLVSRYVLFAWSQHDTWKELAAFQESIMTVGNFLISSALAYLYGAHKS